VADHDVKYLELSSVYVLGVLDGDDLKQFEAHLKTGCPVCAAEMRSFREVASVLPLGLSQLAVSPDLKERVMFNAGLAKVAKAFIDAAPPVEIPPDEALPAKDVRPVDKPPVRRVELAPRERSRSWFQYALVLGVVVLLGGFAFYVRGLFKTISSQDQYIATQQAQITRLLDEVERKEAILRIFGSRRVQIVSMDGLGVNPVGYGTIVWDPDRKEAVLHVSNLPRVPEGKDYQLWIIKAQKPVSAGVFAVTNDREKESFFQVRPLEVADRREVDAFAVTLEPKGGVPQPTGEMYLLGKSSSQ
jgi:anti-sigma-K factor RskA